MRKAVNMATQTPYASATPPANDASTAQIRTTQFAISRLLKALRRPFKHWMQYLHLPSKLILANIRKIFRPQLELIPPWNRLAIANGGTCADTPCQVSY